MENIEVSVRIRPPNAKEVQNNDEAAWKVENNSKTMTLLLAKSLPSPQTNTNSARPTKNIGPKSNNYQLFGSSKPSCFDNMPSSSPHNLGHSQSSSSLSPFSQGKQKRKKSKNSNKQNTTQTHNFQLGQAVSTSICNNSSQHSFMSQSNSSISLNNNQPSVAVEQKRKVSYTFGKVFLYLFNLILDQCFRDEDSNHQIYQQMVKRIALSSLNGINGTVFVYGQTGSGKTYTMLGRERKEVMQSETPSGNNKTNKKDRNANSDNSRKNNTKGQGNTSSIKNSESKMCSSPDKSNRSAHKEGQNSNCSPTKQNMAQSINEAAYLSGRKQTSHIEQPGILIYSLEDIFNEIREEKEKTYFLRCSYVEIYNELVYDLLRDQETINECLQLNEDKNKDFYIRGVIEEPVSSIEEILYFLRRGELNRHYAQTKLNHSSSRSHTLFRLQVQSITNNFLQKAQGDGVTAGVGGSSHNTHSNGETSKHQTQPTSKDIMKRFVTQSVLNFVDLAGSEKVSSHYDNKDPDEIYVMDFGDQTPKIDEKVQTRIKEGKNINKSLFFLTQVISLRAEGRPSSSPGNQGLHIPYRNSPLTKILRSSLGGNARTAVIVCATPCKSQIEQTLSSLRFGQNAMKIENKVQANIITNNNEEAVKILIADYERKIKSLEKVKKEQSCKRDYEMRMIEVLLEEKKKLQDKIHSISNKKFKSLVSATGQCHLLDYRNIELAAQKSLFMVTMENVGNLEITEKLGQHILSMYDKNNFESGLKQEIDLRSTKKQHPYIEKCYKSMALDVIKISRQTTVVGQEQIKQLQRAIQELKFENQQLEEKLSYHQENTQQKQDVISKMGSIFEDIKQENEILKQKEKFYEGDDTLYVQQVKDEWLNVLENKFSNIIEKLKEEKARRHYKDKIENLKEQIKRLQEIQGGNGGQGAQEQQQTLESVLLLLQQSECQSLIEGVKASAQQQQCEDEVQYMHIEKKGSISIKSNSYKYNNESQFDQVSQCDASSVIQFKTDLDQMLKQCDMTQKDDIQSQKHSARSQQKRKSHDLKKEKISSQDSSFNNRLHKIQDELKKREDIISQCTSMLEQMNVKIDQGPNGCGNSTQQEGGRNSTQHKASNPCLLMQKRSLVKKNQRNKSLQIGSKSQQNIDFKQKRRLRSMQKKYGNVNSSTLLNIHSTKSLNIHHESILQYSPPKAFNDDQGISFNFFGNFHKIAPQSVTASSALNNFVKDMDEVRLPSNMQHSFQLETSPISPGGAKSEKKSNRGGGACLNYEGQVNFIDGNEDEEDEEEGDGEDEDELNKAECAEGNGHIQIERHIDSFAMTNRESNDNLNSNNLFETLQGNIDQFSHNDLIINANDYVSFKQTSNNKANFVMEGSFSQSKHKQKESGAATKSKRKSIHESLIQEIQQNFTHFTGEKSNYTANQQHSSINSNTNSNGSHNIISLNFNQENIITSYEVNQTAFFDQQHMSNQSQQQKQGAQPVVVKNIKEHVSKKKAQRENIEPPSLSPMSRSQAKKETQLKIELIKNQEYQIMTSREHKVSPNNKMVEPLHSSKSQSKILIDSHVNDKSAAKPRQSLVGPQKTASKKNGGNIFQYSRHMQQNEGKIFQPLLAKQKLQIDVGAKPQIPQSSQKTNESPLNLTPRAKLAKTNSKKNITPRI